MNTYKSIEKKGKGLREVLLNISFRKLWVAQIFSQLADKFLIVLTVYLITENWSESTILIGYDQKKLITLLATGIYISNSLPAIFFGTFAGIASDLWPRLKVMILSNYLRAVFSTLIPFCLLNGPVFFRISWGYWYLILITFFISFLTQFFTPAEQSSIPLLIDQENLLAANSLYQATTMGATILGFAFGYPLLRMAKFIGYKIGFNGGEFILLPICYLIASIVLNKVYIPEKINYKIKKNIFKEILSGINILKRMALIRSAIFQLVILYSLMAALWVLTINLSTSIPELGPTKFGTLLSFCGLGIAIGAVYLAQKGYLLSKRKLSTLGLLLITLCLLLLTQFEGLLISTLITCLTLGIGASLVAIPAQTIIQEKTPPKDLGKILGLQNNLINIALSAPLVIAGGLVSRFGASPVLFLLAAFTLFGAIFKHP